MIALITGAAGQDGILLTSNLIHNGYKVIALVRNIQQKEFYLSRFPNQSVFICDITDHVRIKNILLDLNPDVLFNLASKSSVKNSWHYPAESLSVNAESFVNILSIVNSNVKLHEMKILQASSSEMFGSSKDNLLRMNEMTPLNPLSPYGLSKSVAHDFGKMYRNIFGLNIYLGIFFNHESPLRSDNFLSKKITKNVVDIFLGKRKEFSIDNLSIKRDWGWAEDYVEAMRIIIELDESEDFIVCTGKQHSVRDFIQEAFEYLGFTDWHSFVQISDSPERPIDLEVTSGDNSKILAYTKWRPSINFREMIIKLIDSEIESRKGVLQYKNE